MVRSLISACIVIMLLSGCAGNSDKGYDNNPAEAAESEGEKDKRNSESNEEAKKTSRPSISVPVEDRTFSVEAAEGGLTEVLLSKLAMQKGKAERVKAFATMMVDDHGAAHKELRTLCAEKGIILRTNCVRCQEKYDQLTALEGDAFDKKYAEIMLSDHQAAVEMFEKEAVGGHDSDLKKWAGEKIPTLQHHLSMAEEMKEQVSGSRKI